MEICVVAATTLECNLIEQALSGEPLPTVKGQRLRSSGRVGPHWVDLVVTGVGVVNTSWVLARALGRFPYKLLVNVGVCGALDHSLAVGSVVNVVSDCFGDLGAEQADGRFMDLDEMNLPLLERRHERVGNHLQAPILTTLEPHLPRVHGVTSSTVHGHAPSIAAWRARWPEAQVETMEGAAVFYAGLRSHIPFVSIRGVSNRVEPRDRAAWRLREASEAAQQSVLNWLQTLPG